MYQYSTVLFGIVFFQTRLVVVSLLSELVKTRDVGSLLHTFKEFGTISKLLHILDTSLQKRVHLEFAEAVLMLFLSASHHKLVCVVSRLSWGPIKDGD